MTPISLPVEGDQVLDILVLEHDPEDACIWEDGKVATHRLLSPAAAPCHDQSHLLCLEHAEWQEGWLRRAAQVKQHFVCGHHRCEWAGTPAEVVIEPLRRRESVS